MNVYEPLIYRHSTLIWKPMMNHQFKIFCEPEVIAERERRIGSGVVRTRDKIMPYMLGNRMLMPYSGTQADHELIESFDRRAAIVETQSEEQITKTKSDTIREMMQRAGISESDFKEYMNTLNGNIPTSPQPSPEEPTPVPSTPSLPPQPSPQPSPEESPPLPRPSTPPQPSPQPSPEERTTESPVVVTKGVSPAVSVTPSIHGVSPALSVAPSIAGDRPTPLPDVAEEGSDVPSED